MWNSVPAALSSSSILEGLTCPFGASSLGSKEGNLGILITLITSFLALLKCKLWVVGLREKL